jgi:hypothetical protein
VLERAGVDGGLVAVPVRLLGGCAAPDFLAVLPLADPLGRLVAAAGSVTGDALAVLDAVTAGLRARFAGLDTVAAHEVAAHLTGGMLLAPALPPLAGNTTLAAVAAVCSS